jgi:hypothetical protein
MGGDALINEQILEDLIVKAFQQYEQGLWPFHIRSEVRNIINTSKLVLDKGEKTWYNNSIE